MSCCTPTPQDATPCCAKKGRHTACLWLLVCLAVVMVVGSAVVLRDGLRDFQGEKRQVSVRGLSEREVKADLAVWPFTLTTTDNDMTAAQSALEAQETHVRAFLKDQGLDTGELAVLRFDAQDLLAQQYRPQEINQGRFVLSKTLLLRTRDVEKVNAASQAMDALVKKGVPLGRSAQPNYIFTKLNDIKPDMIREATANAYDAAQQFATDSGARVGDIISANQGVFSIEGRDQINYLGDGVALTQELQLDKNVRVVTTVTYKLD